MGILEISTLEITNLESTTGTLAGNTAPGITTLGASTTSTGVLVTDKDEEGNKYVNPKKLATATTTAAAIAAAVSINLNSGIAHETKKQAEEMGITEETFAAVNGINDVLENFDSLTDEEQVAWLVAISEKEHALQNEQMEEKALTKHL